LNYVEIGGGGIDCLLQEKMHKEEREMGEGGRGQSLGHKLNITNNMTDKIILSVILLVKILCRRTIYLFLNLIVILFVIPSVYTEKFFLSAYLRTYFTIRLIPPVVSSVKVTCHHTIWLFFHFLFFHCNSLSIYRENFSVSVYW
jgi:hypothetical protein